MAVLVTAFAVVLALVAVLIAGILRTHAEILRALHAQGVNLDPDAVSATAVSGVAVTARRSRDEWRPAIDRNRGRRTRAFSSRVRAERIDRDLLDAGLDPGSSSLYSDDDTSPPDRGNS